MKKLLLLSAFVGCLATASFASNARYIVDETAVDNLFAQSSDLSMAAAGMSVFELMAPTSVTNLSADDEVTRKGFIVRTIFCGWLAMHRTYLGTEGMFWKYFCTVGVIPCGDLIYTLCKKENFDNFQGSDKWVVWYNK